MKVKVSIITPAYNSSKFIGETIKSVINQSYSNWEMIIVDDCSNDDTYQIVNGYIQDDSRIKYFKNQKNIGVAATRNVALSHATGEYIAFLDSDDLWKPEKLTAQLKFMEENHYAITYTNYQMFDSITGKLGKVIFAPKFMRHNDIYKNTSIGCLTVMVNRDMVGYFEMPLLSHAEDQCTWQEIINRGFIAYGLNENLSLYRTSADSMTANKFNAAKKQWHMYRAHCKFSIFKSTFYLSCYALNALIKRI